MMKQNMKLLQIATLIFAFTHCVYGENIIFDIINNNDIENLKTLLKKDTKGRWRVTFHSKTYDSPLVYAIKNNHNTAAKILISYGADLFIGNKKLFALEYDAKQELMNTPLLVAIKNNRIDIALYLIKQKLITYHYHTDILDEIIDFSLHYLFDIDFEYKKNDLLHCSKRCHDARDIFYRFANFNNSSSYIENLVEVMRLFFSDQEIILSILEDSQKPLKKYSKLLLHYYTDNFLNYKQINFNEFLNIISTLTNHNKHILALEILLNYHKKINLRAKKEVKSSRLAGSEHTSSLDKIALSIREMDRFAFSKLNFLDLVDFCIKGNHTNISMRRVLRWSNRLTKFVQSSILWPNMNYSYEIWFLIYKKLVEYRSFNAAYAISAGLQSYEVMSSLKKSSFRKKQKSLNLMSPNNNYNEYYRLIFNQELDYTIPAIPVLMHELEMENERWKGKNKNLISKDSVTYLAKKQKLFNEWQNSLTSFKFDFRILSALKSLPNIESIFINALNNLSRHSKRGINLVKKEYIPEEKLIYDWELEDIIHSMIFAISDNSKLKSTLLLDKVKLMAEYLVSEYGILNGKDLYYKQGLIEIKILHKLKHEQLSESEIYTHNHLLAFFGLIDNIKNSQPKFSIHQEDILKDIYADNIYNQRLESIGSLGRIIKFIFSKDIKISSLRSISTRALSAR